MRALVILLAITCFACSEKSEGTVEANDASRVHDAAASCPQPLRDASWLPAAQKLWLEKLTGAQPIDGETSLAARFTTDERELVKEFLIAELDAMNIEHTSFAFDTGENIIATMGTAITEDAPAIVIGAHFDSVQQSPAAGDNGTGVVVVLSLLRWLKENPCIKQPIVAGFFDKEESGLLGSHFWAEDLRKTKTAVKSVYIFDLISWDEDKDRAVELWSPDPELAELFNTVGRAQGMPIQPVTFDLSDHQSFIDLKFRTVGVSEEFVGGDFNIHYHKPSDVVENVNYGYLAEVTALSADVLLLDTAVQR